MPEVLKNFLKNYYHEYLSKTFRGKNESPLYEKG
jgi:hypothetical protein